MKRVLPFLLLIVCITRAQAAPKGEALLRAMMQAERTISYSATETIARAGASSVVARLRRQGIKRRLEYSAPPIMKGDVLVDNGQIVWRFHKAENSAVKTKTAGSTSTTDIDSIRRRFEAKTKGQATLIGRKAWVVAIMPRGKSQVLRKMWIDDKTKIRLRAERFDARGNRVETWALSNLKIGKISAASFNYIPPRGTIVTNAGTLFLRLNQAKRQANWLRAPTKLPRGYAFESAIIDERKNEAWLRYSSGTRRFSIFQQHTSDAGSTPFKRAGRGWYWQKGGNRYLIAGLPQAQAQIVAKSVK
jgi:negative regulator of sigma E activity